MQPPLKWAGGKRRILPLLSELLPKSGAKRCVEPFCGGAAMFFHLREHHPDFASDWELGDANRALISFYEMLSAFPQEIAEGTATMAANQSRQLYEARRSLFNSLIHLERVGHMHWHQKVVMAQLFLLLNKTGFKGLYRVNRAGNFNVPYNDGNNWKPSSTELLDSLLPCARALAGWMHFRAGEFDVDRVKADDFLFLDPPYVHQDGHTAYTAGKFGEKQLRELAESCKTISARRAKFMLTHTDNNLAREVFGAFSITEIVVQRAMSNGKAAPEKVGEIVVRNYE